MKQEIIRKKGEILSALAHPLRLRILDKLREGPCCVCKIIPYVGGEQSNVSHHLAILRRAHIVQSEKRGIEVWYRVTDQRVYGIIDQLENLVLRDLRESTTLLAAIEEKEDER
ncbi:MAG: winged helix-turn-helix transcriptional regulator [candidate division WOR-3 bacterium]|nr:MAG: winged helix-turn-helix transcriptional regulator [candidate division WOR-3 bacterium]